MAKRKRLTLPDGAPLADHDPSPAGGPMFPLGLARSAPPIARVAGDAATAAALGNLTDEITAARDEGRLIQSLPLAAVDAGYLVRDRILADEADLDALMASLRARGQQTPIEVVALAGGAYGLISGWRRLTALRRLHAEAPDDPRFATVQAILRRPESASDAYLAMVEENEIRVGLSYYERARIVARAAEAGVFPDAGVALQRLFASASRTRRSKIGSFLRLYQTLDDHLRFPSAIPERLGLTLARALEADPTLAPRLRDRRRKTPPPSPEAELAALDRATRPPAPPVPQRTPARITPPEDSGNTTISPDIRMETALGRITLSGPGVTGLLQMRLISWLRDQAGR
jgi:ParB family chromosome partitioning protein